MKLISYQHHGRSHVGQLDASAKWVLPLLDGRGEFVTSMLQIVSGEVPLTATQPGRQKLLLAEVDLLAPLPRPRRNVLCVGKNYRDHAEEFSRSGFDASTSSGDMIPKAPIFFTKAPECVIASGQPIRYPAGVSDQLDYEAELAVVIGVGGRGISRSEAFQHVFGYTLLNDVTARDLQARNKQWFLGKSLDTFCPMGPALVTADEWSPAGATIRCWINEELRQEASIDDLIFDIPTLIETLSAGMTLFPGDIIATGTPAGVGIGFTPPRFLNCGDRVRVEVSGIGTLQNSVA